jgi:hypothetical protein
MSETERLLGEKLEEIFAWERAKQRERVWLTAFVSAAAATMIALLLEEIARVDLPLALIFPIVFGGAAAAGWRALPGREKARLQAVALADRRLDAGETLLTAWEILRRGGRRAPELLVLREAVARIASFAPRSALPRPFLWQAVAAPLLAVVLISSVALHEAGFRLVPSGLSASLAAILQARAREYREKAEAQRLPRSLELARVLEELATDALRGRIGEEELRERLADLAGKAETDDGAASPTESARSGAAAALRAELEAWKHLAAGALPSGRGSRQLQGLESDWWGGGLEESLSRFPGLRQELRRRLAVEGSREGPPSRAELESTLRALETEIASELDRAAQQEMRNFVASLLSKPAGQERSPPTEATAAASSPSKEPQPAHSHAQLPGTEPGQARSERGRAEGPSGGVATQLRGMVREGSGARAAVRAENPKGESRLPPREVLARYQRQAEEALASEEIPEALKETVRNYFLSLAGEERDR